LLSTEDENERKWEVAIFVEKGYRPFYFAFEVSNELEKTNLKGNKEEMSRYL